jgi:hypothetical protein
MTWAVFGDTNGLNSMGEASIKTAQTCFGSGMTGNNGHDEADVLCRSPNLDLTDVADDSQTLLSLDRRPSEYKTVPGMQASLGDWRARVATC